MIATGGWPRCFNSFMLHGWSAVSAVRAWSGSAPAIAKSKATPTTRREKVIEIMKKVGGPSAGKLLPAPGPGKPNLPRRRAALPMPVLLRLRQRSYGSKLIGICTRTATGLPFRSGTSNRQVATAWAAA